MGGVARRKAKGTPETRSSPSMEADSVNEKRGRSYPLVRQAAVSKRRRRPEKCSHSAGRISERVDHVLPAVLRVADQPLTLWIDDPVEQFQRHLADQHGGAVRQFHDLADAVSALDAQAHGMKDLKRDEPASSARLPGSQRQEAELVDNRAGC